MFYCGRVVVMGQVLLLKTMYGMGMLGFVLGSSLKETAAAEVGWKK